MDDIQSNMMQWAAEQFAYQVDQQMTNPTPPEPPVERDLKAERLKTSVPGEVYCPYCGEYTVVVEPGEGDY